MKMTTEEAFVKVLQMHGIENAFGGLDLNEKQLKTLVSNIHNEIKCRTLFATHYHELTQLSHNFPNIKNAKVAIREWKDEIIFLHQVKSGTADKSYVTIAR